MFTLAAPEGTEPIGKVLKEYLLNYMEPITYLFESNFTRESYRTESFSDAG